VRETTEATGAEAGRTEEDAAAPIANVETVGLVAIGGCTSIVVSNRSALPSEPIGAPAREAASSTAELTMKLSGGP